MYKIYINENTLVLADSQLVRKGKHPANHLVAPYTGKTKMLLSYIDMLEKTNRFDNIVIHHKDPKLLLKDFESLFTVVKAAGGIVNDGDDNLLFIFRRGFWDLPKGKIDPGEKKKAAAIREVEEETGISNITLKKKIHTTRHTYKLKSGKRAIKKTFWYAMNAEKQKLTPQLEEDITDVKWVNISKVFKFKEPMFKNIANVLEQYLDAYQLA